MCSSDLMSGCTLFNAVPILFSAVMANSVVDTKTLCLQKGLIGGSKCSKSFFAEIEKAYGLTLISSLGMTECTAGITVCSIDDSFDVRCNTIGHFISSIDGKIYSTDSTHQLSIDETGEIGVKGYCVTSGYYKQESLFQQSINSDGYFRTGDLGSLDKTGNICYHGRIKQTIIRGGENISPLEIEDVLENSSLPISESKVIGIDDPHYGEEIVACIIMEKGKTVTSTEVRDTIGKHLSYFKVPKYVIFLDEFPKTPSGKVMLMPLKEIVKNKIAASKGN